MYDQNKVKNVLGNILGSTTKFSTTPIGGKARRRMMKTHSTSPLSHWKNKDAAQAAMRLWKKFGSPAAMTTKTVVWTNIKPFTRVWVKDESISHRFPMPHKDYLYSSKKVAVPAKLLTPLGRVTGSIIYDGLKKEVTARCAMLIKNAVTIGFVEDVVKGKAQPTKKEYARRITGNITPAWYKHGKI